MKIYQVVEQESGSTEYSIHKYSTRFEDAKW